MGWFRGRLAAGVMHDSHQGSQYRESCVSGRTQEIRSGTVRLPGAVTGAIRMAIRFDASSDRYQIAQLRAQAELPKQIATTAQV